MADFKPLPPLRLSEEQIQKGREALERLVARTAQDPPVDIGPHDRLYFEALTMDEEPDPGYDPEGVKLRLARIKPPAKA